MGEDTHKQRSLERAVWMILPNGFFLRFEDVYECARV